MRSQSNDVAERVVQTVEGQVRTMIVVQGEATLGRFVEHATCQVKETTTKWVKCIVAKKRDHDRERLELYQVV